MSKEKQLRSHFPATGSFGSFPDAFKGADDGLKYAPKIAFQIVRVKEGKHHRLKLAQNAHVILFDLEAIDASKLNPRQLIRDCELLKRAAETHPQKLKTILSAFAKDAPRERIVEAARIAAELNLSEEASSKEGGGLLGLIALGAAIALAGCFVDDPNEWEPGEPDLSDVQGSPEEPGMHVY